MSEFSPNAGEDDPAPTPCSPASTLYRRVPAEWYKPGGKKQIPFKAFMPRHWESDEKPGDVDGLSVDQSHLTTIDKASTMPTNGRKAHLCEFGVSDVTGRGMSAIIKPIPENPAHALIPEMNSLDRRDPEKDRIIEEHALALRNCSTIVFDATI